MPAAIAGLAEVIGGESGIFGATMTWATALSLSTTIITTAAELGASLVIQEIANLLRAPVGTTISLRQPQAFRTAVYGRARIGGTWFPIGTAGDNAGELFLIVIHCDGPVQGCNGLYFDGKQVHVDANGDSIDQRYYDNEGNVYNFGQSVHWEFFDGTQTTACQTLVENEFLGWDDSCVLKGICYSFLHLQYNSTIYPSGVPGIRADIAGKNDIYDPRTGLTGYTENWALCVADFLCHNPDFYGLGCNYATEIDEDQLIAAANICDEAVALAGPPAWQPLQIYQVGQSVNGGGYMQVCTQEGTSLATAPAWNVTLNGYTTEGPENYLTWQNQGSATGLTEPRYAMNGGFSMDRAAGDILNEMMTAAAGRIVNVGGLWKIFPAAWNGPSLSLTDNDLIGPIKWSSKRKYRDLVNGVKGTFVCPIYPYLAAGPGLPLNQKQSGVFNGEWQPTDFPPYCQDNLHGYGTDANYTGDGNIRLWLDTRFPYTISAAATQRIAKIMLLRNRQQGLGTLQCKQTSLLSQTLDVLEMTHTRWASNGWTNKLLEIAQSRLNFKTEEGNGKNRKPPQFYIELDVQETDPSVYAWSTTEELTIEDGPSPAVALVTNVGPPLSVTLASGPDEVITGADGIARSQILVSWDTPTDLSILNGGSMELQYQQLMPIANLLAAGGALSQWEEASDLTFPGEFSFDLSSNGGIVDILLFASNGSSGPNGYIFRFDGRSGYNAGQILRVDNGTWTEIGTAGAAVNSVLLTGAHAVFCNIGAAGTLSISVDGVLQCTATDATYTPSGQLYYGYEYALGMAIGSLPSSWTPAGTFSASISEAYIGNINDGQQYLVQLRCINVAGVPSNWAPAGPITVSNTVSQITSAALGLNIPFNETNDATIMPTYTSALAPYGLAYGWEIYGPGGPGTSATATMGDGTTITLPAGSSTGLDAATSYLLVGGILTRMGGGSHGVGRYFSGFTYEAYPESDLPAAIPDNMLVIGSFTTMGGAAVPGVVGGGGVGGSGGPRSGTISPTPVAGGVDI